MQRTFGRNRLQQLFVIMGALALSGCLSSGEDTVELDGTSSPASGNAAPQISGSPSASIRIGDTYSFVPSAADPDGDALTFSIENKPTWASFDSATGRLSGQPTLGDIGNYSSILISVSDGQASVSLPRFAVSVSQVGAFTTTLSWMPPLENEDGSQLVDLAGYRVYWGAEPGSYTNSATITNPGITTYVVENLTAGTYVFVATAFNAAGVESMFSNSVTKTFQ